MREESDLLYLVINIFFPYENRIHRAAEVYAADALQLAQTSWFGNH